MDSISIDVITSPNCTHSPVAMRIARKLVQQRKEPILLREVSIASEAGAELADGLSLEATPAIIINGSLAYIGVPTMPAMRKMLSETLKREKERNSYFF